MKVINLFGGPGSGKSTTAAGLFYFMKLAGYKVELVTEYAKELVYDETLELMLDRQEVIFAEQNQRLHRLRGKVDFAIIDSPLLLSCVYPDMNQSQRGVGEWPALSAFKSFVIQVIRTYDNMNFFLMRPDSFEAYGREHDLGQSQEIDLAIIKALKANDFDWATIQTSPDSVHEIMEDVVQQSHK